MKIAVNARMLTQRRPGGIGRYARETLQRITDRHREHEFLFIVDRPFRERGAYPENVTVARIFPSFHVLLWYPWFEIGVPHMLKKFQADLFLSPDGFCCLSTAAPTVAVIHDLSFHHHPEDMPVLIRRYYNHFFPKYAQKAKTIATVSEFSRQDLIASYGVEPDKITVTYNGAGKAFRPLPEEERKKAREEFAGGSPYFLSVGALHPRKNLVRLLEAYDAFKKETKSPAKLVVVGPRLFKTGALFQAWQRMCSQRDVLFPGTVSDETLARIYGGAHAFFFVSYFEGFGIPAIEAMGCDIPVVAAARTSLPEVCGDAAHLVDPFSVSSIARAMKDIYFDEALRRNLVEKGRTQHQRFGWDRTADLLWKAIERSLP